MTNMTKLTITIERGDVDPDECGICESREPTALGEMADLCRLFQHRLSINSDRRCLFCMDAEKAAREPETETVCGGHRYWLKKWLDECGPEDFGYDVACAECKAERLKWRNPFCMCGRCLKQRQDEKEANK